MQILNLYSLPIPAVKEIDDIVSEYVAREKPEYDFVAEDGFGHHFWLVRKPETNTAH